MHPNWSPSVGALARQRVNWQTSSKRLSGESKDAFKSFLGPFFEHCGMEQSSCKAVLYRDSPWCDLSPYALQTGRLLTPAALQKNMLFFFLPSLPVSPSLFSCFPSPFWRYTPAHFNYLYSQAHIGAFSGQENHQRSPKIRSSWQLFLNNDCFLPPQIDVPSSL